jgi:uncharacterized protein (TIGR03083 family)
MARTAEQWQRAGFESVRALTGEFLELVESLDDEQASALVPGGGWTAAETAAHVCSLFRRLTEDTRRAADPDGVVRQNAEDIRAIGTDLAAIREEIDARLATVRNLVDLVPADHEFAFHSGQSVTLAAGFGVMIGELVVHGDDIALATGAKWSPDAAPLELLWRLTIPVLQGWLRPDARSTDETWELQFGWDSGPVVVHVDQGRVEVEDPHEAATDHVVLIDDPVEFTLAFPYGRRRPPDKATARLASLFHPV